MQTIELTSQKRETSTKGALRQVRLAGRVPAVVYGGQGKPSVTSVDAKEFLKMIKAHGRNVLVNLKSEAGVELALVQELQRDIISHAPIHVDFRRISMTETIEVAVPLHVTGEAPGVKLQGGIMEFILHELRIQCLPSEIPAHINIDVSGLNINQGLRVKDVSLPKGVALVNTDGERLVLNIVAPTEFKEETPAAGAATAAAGAAEPEVIAKGKTPEEGAEGAAAAPAAGAKDAKAAAPAAKAAPAKEGAKK